MNVEESTDTPNDLQGNNPQGKDLGRFTEINEYDSEQKERKKNNRKETTTNQFK